MIKFKKGVKVFGIRPELILAFQVADPIYSEYEADVVVTSVRDGRHSYTSLHYIGCAADIRTKNLPNVGNVEAVAKEIRQALTNEYDIIVERDHIHIEFQPKRE